MKISEIIREDFRTGFLNAIGQKQLAATLNGQEYAGADDLSQADKAGSASVIDPKEGGYMIGLTEKDPATGLLGMFNCGKQRLQYKLVKLASGWVWEEYDQSGKIKTNVQVPVRSPAAQKLNAAYTELKGVLPI